MEFKKLESLEQVPVLHVRGTHYAVGYSIGRTYLGFIQNYLDTFKYFTDILLPVYSTVRGRQNYDKNLERCQRKYPKYCQELQGIADGAGIPFHHLFLLHLDTMIAPENDEGQAYDVEEKIISSSKNGNSNGHQSNDGESVSGLLGCTSVLCNSDDIILGHTEDTPAEMVNHFFIVCAHIVDEKGKTLEKFSTLTYPGYLPGYTMGFNQHGIVYSVNTIYPSRTYGDRTPVHFLSRALLAARNEKEVMDIIKDTGTGIADGFSLNLFFVKDPQKEDGEEVVVCNIEIGPNRSNGDESVFDVHWVQQGTSYVHCNKYLRMDIPEQQGPSFISSCRRHDAIEKANPPNCIANIKHILSDRSDTEFPVFRTSSPLYRSFYEVLHGSKDIAATVAVGIFDIKRRTWSLYTKPPNTSDPVVELPLVFNF